ncbi:MAG: DUF1670 domain-containing protein, partial [Candidatus Aminicenantes bacterium]|nr:DUF1670 domain-containing protein [Candidatus Aminicenantes bacterium]
MGQTKYHRFNIKQQIHSLQFKTKYHYLKNINITQYGLCAAEAELLAEIADQYYQAHLLAIPENHFSILLYDHFNSNKKQNLKSLPQKKVDIPAFSHYELDIYQEYGLKTMQNYRILNILDAIAFQDAKIDINLLAMIVNITPKAIRQRLVPFLERGVTLPLVYLSKKWSSQKPASRYVKALEDFFIHGCEQHRVCEKYLIAKLQWHRLVLDFYQLSYGQQTLSCLPPALLEEICALKDKITTTSRYREYSRLYPPIPTPQVAPTDKKEILRCTLKHYFSFSDALVNSYLGLLEHEASRCNQQRKDGEIIYYAVSEDTGCGTPLAGTALVPTRLTMFSQDDKQPPSPYQTNTRKWNKMNRYCIQAQSQKAVLSQYDLAYLSGVSVPGVKSCF